MALIILIVLSVAGIGMIALGLVWMRGGEYKKAEVIIGENKFEVEVADDMVKRSRGLSGREELGEKEGMLFVYEIAGSPGFWMKEMNFPIDIIWIKNGKVLGFEEKMTPESYKEKKIFYPPEKIKMILEVRAGIVEKLNIKEGEEIIINW